MTSFQFKSSPFIDFSKLFGLQVSKRASTSKKGQPPKEPGKGQLWDGLVSIILVEGKKMIPMDDSGEERTTWLIKRLQSKKLELCRLK